MHGEKGVILFSLRIIIIICNFTMEFLLATNRRDFGFSQNCQQVTILRAFGFAKKIYGKRTWDLKFGWWVEWGGSVAYEKRNGMEWGILCFASYILLISIGWDIVYLGKEMFSLLVSRSLMCLSYGIVYLTTPSHQTKDSF